MRTADFDYVLPPELIAQTPLERRDASRLLVLDRQAPGVIHSRVDRLRDHLRPGDLLVANNSRVLAARLEAVKSETGGRIELLLLHPSDGDRWTALARPARRLKPGDQLHAGELSRGIVVHERGQDGLIEISLAPEIIDNLDSIGSVPLPPYIHERLADPDRYQTVYASRPGSAAAPTAGLHFTEDTIASLKEAGIGWCEVTLDIGLDTFRPVTVDAIADHTMHSETCRMNDEAVAAVVEAMRNGNRVIALGTTAARTLETAGRIWAERGMSPFETQTDIFITPGYEWRVVDGLFTNFHLPRSTLLMMVSALAGRERILSVYRTAIQHRYRFFSFGDAMLIL